MIETATRAQNDSLRDRLQTLVESSNLVEEACTNAYAAFLEQNDTFVKTHQKLLDLLKRDVGLGVPAGGVLRHKMSDGSDIVTRMSSADRTPLYLGIRTLHNPLSLVGLSPDMTPEDLDTVAPPTKMLEHGKALHDAIQTVGTWKF